MLWLQRNCQQMLYCAFWTFVFNLQVEWPRELVDQVPIRLVFESPLDIDLALDAVSRCLYSAPSTCRRSC